MMSPPYPQYGSALFYLLQILIISFEAALEVTVTSVFLRTMYWVLKEGQGECDLAENALQLPCQPLGEDTARVVWQLWKCMGFEGPASSFWGYVEFGKLLNFSESRPFGYK